MFNILLITRRKKVSIFKNNKAIKNRVICNLASTETFWTLKRREGSKPLTTANRVKVRCFAVYAFQKHCFNVSPQEFITNKVITS